jgi:hypothetical protein
MLVIAGISWEVPGRLLRCRIKPWLVMIGYANKGKVSALKVCPGQRLDMSLSWALNGGVSTNRILSA